MNEEKWPDALFRLKELHLILERKLEDMTVAYLKTVTKEQIIAAYIKISLDRDIEHKDSTIKMLRFLNDIQHGHVEAERINNIIEILISQRNTEQAAKASIAPRKWRWLWEGNEVNILLLQLQQLI